jgi:plasmid stabilization system protein ParE
MALRVLLTEIAQTRIDEKFEYLTSEFGGSTARSFLKQLFRFIELVSYFPEIGKIEVFDKNIRSFRLNKQSSVFFLWKTTRFTF